MPQDNRAKKNLKVNGTKRVIGGMKSTKAPEAAERPEGESKFETPQIKSSPFRGWGRLRVFGAIHLTHLPFQMHPHVRTH